ncbi:MAG: mycothiol system anti-sigma-R factor [Ancrocorticia populi]|uniref:mycothiol system anti-sigma-R factor n=1 Tax=Ancrocorticia populi TaxID=2175228 RepID=UPI002702E72B|nr:mycothiol system anti-sigma-R factor [Ancrocorticia sp.]
MSEREPDQFAIELEEKMKDSAAECTCSEVADHLFELLDAQMPKEQEARLRSHAETCPHCNELAEAEVHVRTIVKRSCCESAPSTLREKISRQITVFKTTTN